ncbi:hypothetical protein CAEBREN_02396 [Caenorhabditis brenneri]|uniref:Uncharacterized protein n=1 Tax=Caenorhabditis brenneri TaxID=135651 RepID=G0NE94_CAEBE|nr:hypothetical protein CAEBREN_02396 [Caenorhabditis brenneri]
MQTLLRLLVVFLLILVLVNAQYRMMANYGPAWRQKMWRKTRVPSTQTYADSAVDTGLMDLLAN